MSRWASAIEAAQIAAHEARRAEEQVAQPPASLPEILDELAASSPDDLLRLIKRAGTPPRGATGPRPPRGKKAPQGP